MLIEFKDTYYHYTIDDQHCLQGEFKSWWSNGKLEVHCVYINDKRHGEFKQWDSYGQLNVHCFYVDDEYVSFDEIPLPTTSEELMLFKLKYDLQLLSDTTSACAIIAAS